jgi:hypothetical protein
MTTTLEISDPRLDQASSIAARQGTTPGALIEPGLRRVIDEPGQERTFCPRDGSVGGNGLRAEPRGASWDRLRELAHRAPRT